MSIDENGCNKKHYKSVIASACFVLQAIDNLLYDAGRTNIAAALSVTRTRMFTANNGDRLNVPVCQHIRTFSPMIRWFVGTAV